MLNEILQDYLAKPVKGKVLEKKRKCFATQPAEFDLISFGAAVRASRADFLDD